MNTVKNRMRDNTDYRAQVWRNSIQILKNLEIMA